MHKTYEEDAHSKLRTKLQKQKHDKEQSQDFPTGDVSKAGQVFSSVRFPLMHCTISAAEVSKNPEEKISIVVTHPDNNNIFVNISIVKSIIIL